MLDRTIINEIVSNIAKAINPKRIVLFGSYASGKASEDSDLDLLVVVEDSDLPQYKKARGIRKHLLGITDIPKDIVVYTEKEIRDWRSVKNSFISNILDYGKVVYEN